jgi:hypothetical protein
MMMMIWKTVGLRGVTIVEDDQISSQCQQWLVKGHSKYLEIYFLKKILSLSARLDHRCVSYHLENSVF